MARCRTERHASPNVTFLLLMLLFSLTVIVGAIAITILFQYSRHRLEREQLHASHCILDTIYTTGTAWSAINFAQQ